MHICTHHGDARNIHEQIQLTKDGYQAATTAQRAYNELVEQRNQLATHLQVHAEQLSIQRCPLCGQTYEDVQKLLESVQSALQLQLTSFTVINDQVARNFERLKVMVAEVIDILNTNFQERGINQDIVSRYDALDKKKLDTGVKNMTDNGMLSDLPKTSLEETERAFRNEVQGMIQAFDETLDYVNMKTIFDGYVRFMPKKLRNVETVQGKRNYLLQIWNRKKSQQMQQLVNEVAELQRKINQYNNLENQLKQIKD